MKIIGWVGASSLALALAAPARAQLQDDPGREALELARQGELLSETGEDREAAERYRRAFDLLPLPSFAVRAAESLTRLGELVEAHSLYLAAALSALPSAAPPEQVAARLQAEVERQKLLRRIPTVVVLLSGASPRDVSVTINDVPVPSTSLGQPRMVDPGKVRVKGVRGATSVETTAELRESEAKSVTLAFGPDGSGATAQSATSWNTGPRAAAPRERALDRERAAAGDNQRLLGYIATGVGGAALLTGGAFTLLALQDEADLEARCPLARCPNRLESDVDTYESKKVIAAVGLASGAVLVLGGVTLILTAPSADAAHATRYGVYYAARGGGVWGTF